SGQLVLVHNGVIENFEEIHQTYLSEHTFLGQTDTEIAVHLVEELKNRDNLTTKEAFRKALGIIKGSYAFGLIDKNDRETIYVAKNKSPLLIGLGDGFNVICSDALAVLDQTDTFVEIEDGEMVTVTADSVAIEKQDGQKVVRDSFKTQVDITDIEKGTYPFYMLKEIDEQPTVMRRLVQEYQGENHQVNIDE